MLRAVADPALRILHLVWAPLGAAPLRAFLDAMRGQAPGTPAARTAILNGFADRGEAGEHLELLDGWELHWTSRAHFDLGAYAEAAAAVREPLVCLLNSYARPLAGDWLAKLAAPVREGRAAAAGATGSWESHGSELRLRERLRRASGLRDGLGGTYDWAAYRVRYPRFPNPHLRTNGLVCAREVVAALGPPPRTKDESYVLESGRRGLSRRAGGPLVVVDRDGATHEPEAWPASRTFRSGEQERLLIADNRTGEWDAAGPRERERMARRVWGRG